MIKMTTTARALLGSVAVVAIASIAAADEIKIATGITGNAAENLAKIVAPWEEATGHTVTLVPTPTSIFTELT